MAAALGAGIGLQLAYPGSFDYGGGDGPSFPVWVALIGGALALLAMLWRRPDTRLASPAWAVAVVAAFALPVAVAGLTDLRKKAPDRYALTPGLISALHDLPDDDVVFAPLETSYRVAAYAPVYVAAAPPAHVARTTKNRPYERRADVVRFFRGDTGLGLLEQYGADWLLVDRTRAFPRELVAGLGVAYEDSRYALYALHQA